METIKNIRVLKGAAVLAERNSTTPSLDLKQFNLFYGFNGSGKSTLSRIFSALQHGKILERLPDTCTFEIEMTDGAKLSYPKAFSGLEKRVCVFNDDFIAENLRWSSGAANPVFYIGADQAETAKHLKSLEASGPELLAKQDGVAALLKEREKSFTDFKRILAKTVSERLRQPSRYEATQLIADMEKLTISAVDKLSNTDLDAATATCARSEPPAKVASIVIPIDVLKEQLAVAVDLATRSISSIVVEGLIDHAQMIPWAKQGHDYHVGHKLKSCLYCGESITPERQALLTSAFDDRFSKFLTELDDVAYKLEKCVKDLSVARAAIPAATQLSAEFQPPFESAAAALLSALDAVSPLLENVLGALQTRKSTPTNSVKISLPNTEEVKQLLSALDTRCDQVNAICKQHADMVDAFAEHQKKAREQIRRHFVASSADDYAKHLSEITNAKKNEADAAKAVEQLNESMAALRAKIQQHGPAAEKINALVRSYLGHGELTIVAKDDGYELHRHGALLKGVPSEGEKTAIALCYFLSTLEAEDRKVKDLIVVIDDPISSLDTKALNYACALIRNRLRDAAQLIVLTHNQHCMNEFKKHWKGYARATTPTASLKFIDVTVPANNKTRVASIVDLPKNLREYESEYHYLFEKVVMYEAADGKHFDYAFMMPNVLRRVLEIFLAFKVPRSGPLLDKLKTICERHKDLDANRLNALERLSQVESHSDNIDDLITLSSMTVEESQSANAALIHLMEVVDSSHLSDLRKYCRA